MTVRRRRVAMLLAVCALAGALALFATGAGRDRHGETPARAVQPDAQPADAASKRPATQPGPHATALRVEIAPVPPDSAPEWTLDVEAAGERSHHTGTGADVVRLPLTEPLPPRVALRLTAPGFSTEVAHVAPRLALERRLSLRKLAQISATVRSGEAPVAGAHVEVARTSAAAPGEPATYSGVVGAGGECRIADLPSGEYVLVVRSRDHQPFSESLRLEPGEVRKLDLHLLPGVVISGRVLDHLGRPFAGGKVHFFVGDRLPGGAFAFRHDSWVACDGDGAFVSAGLVEAESVRVIVNAEVDDGVLLIDREIHAPRRGRAPLGTLVPLPATVVFRLPRGTSPEGVLLTLQAMHDRTFAVSATDLVFGANGECRVFGLPLGECSYMVHRRVAGTGSDLLADANVQVEYSGQVIEVVFAPRPDEKPARLPRPKVRSHSGRPVTWLLLDPEGIRDWASGIADGTEFNPRAWVPEGTYRLVVLDEATVGWADLMTGSGAEPPPDVVPFHPADAVVLSVTANDAPAAGAEIKLYGYRKGARGSGLPLGRTDDAGRLSVSPVPSWAEGITVAVMTSHGGRRVFVPRADFADARVDIR